MRLPSFLPWSPSEFKVFAAFLAIYRFGGYLPFSFWHGCFMFEVSKPNWSHPIRLTLFTLLFSLLQANCI